jgi:hypothetical protein
LENFIPLKLSIKYNEKREEEVKDKAVRSEIDKIKKRVEREM